MTISMDDIACVEAQWAGTAQEKIDAVGTRAKAARVKVKTAAVSSDLIGESLVKAAKKYKCELSLWPQMAASASSVCCSAAKRSMC